MPFLIFYDDPDNTPGNGGAVWHGSPGDAPAPVASKTLPLMGVGRIFVVGVADKLLELIGLVSK